MLTAWVFGIVGLWLGNGEQSLQLQPRMRHVTEFLIYMVAAASAFLLVPARWILVRNLKRKMPDLWHGSGSPGKFERDNFLRRYPYRGGREVYRVADRTDRALLLIYALLHATFISFAGIALLI